ncbi:hypothetical protein [Cystobacter fuscus]|uniref:hypothetical protein n=1 Tax=Cystobacter fuscus TaxID=43 RepID=UPI0037C02AD2
MNLMLLNDEVLKHIFDYILANPFTYSGKTLSMFDTEQARTLALVNTRFKGLIGTAYFQRLPPKALSFLKMDDGALQFKMVLQVAQIILREYPPDEWIYAPVGSSPLPVSVFMALLSPQAQICHIVMSGRRKDPDMGAFVDKAHGGGHTRRTPRPALNQFIFERFLPMERISKVIQGEQKVLVIDWSHGETLGLACNYIYQFLRQQKNSAVEKESVLGLTLDTNFPYPANRFYASSKNPEKTMPREFFHDFYLKTLRANGSTEQSALVAVSKLMHDEKYKKFGIRGMNKVYPVDYVEAFSKKKEEREMPETELRLDDIIYLACKFFKATHA